MNSNTYRIILWSSVLGAIVLVVAGLIWLANGGGQKFVYVPGVSEVTADDHVVGKSGAKVTVVEYSDFQCPACAEYYPVLKELVAKYGDRVAFVYRNFPIPGHINGIPAARAAEAAALQGKFAEMEDRLFTHQAEWAALDSGSLAKTFDSYAQALGLDMNKFRSDEASQAVLDKIDKDARSGVKAGVDATPSFFINGVKTQPLSYAEFSGKLDQALAE